MKEREKMAPNNIKQVKKKKTKIELTRRGNMRLNHGFCVFAFCYVYIVAITGKINLFLSW